MSEQTATWYRSRGWGIQLIGQFLAIAPEIAKLWQPLNEKDTGRNYISASASSSIAKHIAKYIIELCPDVHLIKHPPPDANDRYRIILVGHGTGRS